MGDLNLLRTRRTVDTLINKFRLDLSGLTVYTEAASGYYLHTPLLAACAGARVIAYTRNSSWGAASAIRDQTLQAASHWGLSEALRVVFNKDEKDVGEADIITNSGLLRPINAQMASWMKRTAVVALMWEPWEFRASDLDLSACHARGITVIGTNEHAPPCDMRPYSGLFALKMLFEMGIEAHGSKLMLLGAQPTLGAQIARMFRLWGLDVVHFGSTSDYAEHGYDELPSYWRDRGDTVDAVIVAEHHDPVLLIGPGGLLDPTDMFKTNPTMQVGVISGHIDQSSLAAAGITTFPSNIQPFGYMSYQASELGPRPVLELYAAGLKVGQVAVRARLAGLNIEDSIKIAQDEGPGMALPEHLFSGRPTTPN